MNTPEEMCRIFIRKIPIRLMVNPDQTKFLEIRRHSKNDWRRLTRAEMSTICELFSEFTGWLDSNTTLIKEGKVKI